jgi:hypothetical protein
MDIRSLLISCKRGVTRQPEHPYPHGGTCAHVTSRQPVPSFVVWANEIKELARRTADATGDIKEKIEGFQGTTSTTVGQIGEITRVIRAVNDVVADITMAAEEQACGYPGCRHQCGSGLPGHSSVDGVVKRPISALRVSFVTAAYHTYASFLRIRKPSCPV